MKYCGEQGCTNIISKGRYCPDHRRRKKRYKHRGRNQSFYDSAAWKQVSDYIYERDGGLCQRCGKFVFSRYAHRHHIKPIATHPHLKLVTKNIILLCNICHPIVENELIQRKVPDYFG